MGSAFPTGFSFNATVQLQPTSTDPEPPASNSMSTSAPAAVDHRTDVVASTALTTITAPALATDDDLALQRASSARGDWDRRKNTDVSNGSPLAARHRQCSLSSVSLTLSSMGAAPPPPEAISLVTVPSWRAVAMQAEPRPASNSAGLENPPLLLSDEGAAGVIFSFQGTLTKMEGPHFRRWKERYFVQHNNILRYYRNRDSTRVRGAIDLRLVTSICQTNVVGSRALREPYADRVFAIFTPARIWYLMARSNTEMRYWVEGLCDYLRLSTRLMTRNTAAMSVPPYPAPEPPSALDVETAADGKLRYRANNPATVSRRTVFFGVREHAPRAFPKLPFYGSDEWHLGSDITTEMVSPSPSVSSMQSNRSEPRQSTDTDKPVDLVIADTDSDPGSSNQSSSLSSSASPSKSLPPKASIRSASSSSLKSSPSSSSLKSSSPSPSSSSPSSSRSSSLTSLPPVDQFEHESLNDDDELTTISTSTTISTTISTSTITPSTSTTPSTDTSHSPAKTTILPGSSSLPALNRRSATAAAPTASPSVSFKVGGSLGRTAGAPPPQNIVVATLRRLSAEPGRPGLLARRSKYSSRDDFDVDLAAIRRMKNEHAQTSAAAGASSLSRSNMTPFSLGASLDFGGGDSSSSSSSMSSSSSSSAVMVDGPMERSITASYSFLRGSSWKEVSLLPGEKIIWRCSYVVLLYPDTRRLKRKKMKLASTRSDLRELLLRSSDPVSAEASTSSESLAPGGGSRLVNKKGEQSYLEGIDGRMLLSNHKLILTPKASSELESIEIPLFAVKKIKRRPRASEVLVVSVLDGRKLNISFGAHPSQSVKLFIARFAQVVPTRFSPDTIFAYAYAQHLRQLRRAGEPLPNMGHQFHQVWKFDITIDYARMGLPNKKWRVVSNRDFAICSTYPNYLCLPACIDVPTVMKAAQFRTKNRIPTLTWKHPSTDASLSRSSQPNVGLLGSGDRSDELLMEAIKQSNPAGELLHLCDARPKVNAEANKLLGAGYESASAYKGMSIKFFNIDNIHVMRDSWQKLQELCQPQNEANDRWLSDLEATGWFMHIKRILRGALHIVDLIENRSRSVVIHCSDGWDRTAQLCSLAQMLLDPFYRTIHGFAVLVEKDWLAFGHKFQDRCGHLFQQSKSEMSPVFLQFLDCVYQLTQQFPYSFEFNSAMLRFVGEASMDQIFGTFLCNSAREREQHGVYQQCESVWSYIFSNLDQFSSSSYAPSVTRDVLFPSTTIQSFRLWEQFYFRWSHTSKVKRTTTALDELALENRRLNAVLRNQEKRLLEMEAASLLPSGDDNDNDDAQQENEPTSQADE